MMEVLKYHVEGPTLSPFMTCAESGHFCLVGPNCVVRVHVNLKILPTYMAYLENHN